MSGRKGSGGQALQGRHDPIPALPGEKGRRYLCQDSDGLWYYLNHAHTWQGCPAEAGSPNVNSTIGMATLRRLARGEAVVIDGVALFAADDLLRSELLAEHAEKNSSSGHFALDR